MTLRSSEAKSSKDMPEQRLIINIGRQFGSGGKEIASKLGEILGIKVYDNELISRAAETSGFSRELFLRSDEKRSLFSMSSFFTSGRYGNTTDNYVSDHEMFRIQSEVIRDIASKESAVFVGRCSDYILRDMPALSVFVTAPLADRIARVSRRCGISAKEAESLIGKKDRTRETYYNYFTFRNWGMAGNYDLCLDSSILGTGGSADIIIEFAKKQGLLR